MTGIEMQSIKYSAIFIFIFLFAGLPLSAHCEIVLDAPDRVARGDAFLVRVSADRDEKGFIFSWRGKTYSVNADKESGTHASQAQILLPVPLDEKASGMRLQVMAQGEKLFRDKHISFFDRKRPVQKLTVDKKYVTPPPEQLRRIRSDREKVRKALAGPSSGRLWETPFLKPVPGTVSSLFGMKRVFNGEPRSVHKGLDLRGPEGTPIHAAADGEVVLVDDLYYSGKTVYLNHGDGVFSAYMHMSEPKVSIGQTVHRGDVIGLVGATGRVTGPHLHLSFIVQGEPVDPQPLISGKGVR